MTQEERQLLLIDLCARLPYGIQCRKIEWHKKIDVIYTNEVKLSTLTLEKFIKGDYELKPYLRSMSSMTEEEQKEFVKFHCVNICPLVFTDMLTLSNESKMFDWLNEHHFDYRGLIPIGLALEAKEGMYKTE